MEKRFYLTPIVSSYELSISNLTKEQEEYIRNIYEGFKRKKLDLYDHTRYKIIDESKDNFFNEKFEKVIKYLYQQGFVNESSCSYCDLY